MSYQVLARKWRPNSFAELVGQEHVVSAISNALDNDRLHHAYLFTGTRGVGKTTIARIFSNIKTFSPALVLRLNKATSLICWRSMLLRVPRLKIPANY